MKKNFSLMGIIGLIFLISGILSVIYSVVAKLYRVSFAGFFLPLGVLLAAIGLLKLFLKPIKSKLLRLAIKTLHVFILLGFISFIVIELLIVNSAFTKELDRPDYIVVLGAGLWGEQPSLTLQQRLDASLGIINLHPEVKIIVSGGQGPGETITEAEAMKRFYVANGIDGKRIIKEDKSTNTLENLNFTRAVIKQIDNRQNIKISIVTSNFHMFRSKFLAKRVGLEAYGYPAAIHKYLIPAYYTREFFAVVKSFLFDIPSEAPAPGMGVQVEERHFVFINREHATRLGKRG